MPKRVIRSPFVAVTLAVGAAACANEGATATPPTGSPTATTATAGTSGTSTTAGTTAPAGTTGTTSGTATPEGTGSPEGGELASNELPGWKDIPSGHPEGATNPPAPVLNIMKDGPRCFKTWEGGMMRPQGAASVTIGGESYLVRYVDSPRGKQIACPAGLEKSAPPPGTATPPTK
jgi:hypothetical protein